MLNSKGGAEIAARIVTVPLGARSYDIAIGPGMIASGRRSVKRLATVRALRRRHRRNRGQAASASTACPASHRPALAAEEIIIPAGEASKSFTHLVQAVRRAAGTAARSRRHRHRARRRRHRRPRRLRRQHPEARRAPGADPHDAARPGRFLRSAARPASTPGTART